MLKNEKDVVIRGFEKKGVWTITESVGGELRIRWSANEQHPASKIPTQIVQRSFQIERS